MRRKRLSKTGKRFVSSLTIIILISLVAGTWYRWLYNPPRLFKVGKQIIQVESDSKLYDIGKPVTLFQSDLSGVWYSSRSGLKEYRQSVTGIYQGKAKLW